MKSKFLEAIPESGKSNRSKNYFEKFLRNHPCRLLKLLKYNLKPMLHLTIGLSSIRTVNEFKFVVANNEKKWNRLTFVQVST